MSTRAGEARCGGTGRIYMENGSPAMHWEDDAGRFYDVCPGCSDCMPRIAQLRPRIGMDGDCSPLSEGAPNEGGEMDGLPTLTEITNRRCRNCGRTEEAHEHRDDEGNLGGCEDYRPAVTPEGAPEDGEVLTWDVIAENAATDVRAADRRRHANRLRDEILRLRDVVGEVCSRLRKAEAERDAALERVRRYEEFFVAEFWPEDGFGEQFDALVKHGIIVEVPADDAFRDEWGEDEETMWVFSFSELARAALSDTGKEVDDGR